MRRVPNGVAVLVAASGLGCEPLGDEVIVVIAPQPVQVSEEWAADPGDADPRALTAFDEDLGSYGQWLEDDVYGTVWMPADADFVPYATNGHFADIDGDVVWLSGLPWGIATLHHGRWVPRGGRWLWIPGMVYSSAWVTWQRDGERTSWAPAAPAFAWRGNVAVRIAPPAEPIVGSRADDELALVPEAPPPRDVARDEATDLWRRNRAWVEDSFGTDTWPWRIAHSGR